MLSDLLGGIGQIVGVVLVIAVVVLMPAGWDWVRKQSKPVALGVAAVIAVVLLALSVPGYLPRYWFASVLGLIYAAGLGFTWERHTSTPPENVSFYQGGQYAFGYSMDYQSPWEASKRWGKVFAVLVPVLVAISLASWPAELAFVAGIYPLGALVAEVVLLTRL